MVWYASALQAYLKTRLNLWKMLEITILGQFNLHNVLALAAENVSIFKIDFASIDGAEVS